MGPELLPFRQVSYTLDRDYLVAGSGPGLAPRFCQGLPCLLDTSVSDLGWREKEVREIVHVPAVCQHQPHALTREQLSLVGRDLGLLSC